MQRTTVERLIRRTMLRTMVGREKREPDRPENNLARRLAGEFRVVQATERPTEHNHFLFGVNA